MKSYASIDRIEGDFAVCEVEMIPIEESKTADFASKETEMMDVQVINIRNVVGDFSEGDVLVVEHDENEITEIWSKDEEEKQRRVELLEKMIS